jgi:hypothetical protein
MNTNPLIGEKPPEEMPESGTPQSTNTVNEMPSHREKTDSFGKGLG